MAEFCKECFLDKICAPSDKMDESRLIMSEELDFCEGCGNVDFVVVYATPHK